MTGNNIWLGDAWVIITFVWKKKIKYNTVVQNIVTCTLKSVYKSNKVFFTEKQQNQNAKTLKCNHYIFS